jgi:hypothetical protein
MLSRSAAKVCLPQEDPKIKLSLFADIRLAGAPIAPSPPSTSREALKFPLKTNQGLDRAAIP